MINFIYIYIHVYKIGFHMQNVPEYFHMALSNSVDIYPSESIW